MCACVCVKALYHYKKGQDHLAFAWCVRSLNFEKSQNNNLSARVILSAHCALVSARLKEFNANLPFKRGSSKLKMDPLDTFEHHVDVLEAACARLSKQLSVSHATRAASAPLASARRVEDTHTLASGLFTSACLSIRRFPPAKHFTDALRSRLDKSLQCLLRQIIIFLEKPVAESSRSCQRTPNNTF